MAPSRILLFTFLASPDMAALGNGLAEVLARDFQADLAFAGPFPVPGLKPRIVKIPLLVMPFQKICSGDQAHLDLPPGLVRDVIEADQAFHEGGSGSWEEHLRGVAAAHYFYKQMMGALKPGLVLVWGASLPHSPLLYWLAREQGAACLDLERGLFPETFMVRPFSWPDCEGMFRAPWPPRTGDRPGTYEAIRKHYMETRPTKYPQGAFVTGDAFRRARGLAGRRIHLLLTHNDIYAGVSPRSRFLSRTVSPLSASVRETLAYCLEAIRQDPEAVLVFKPHPMDHNDYGDLACPQLIPAGDAHLHTLCDAADVILADSTTAQYEALFFEKPIVSLANSFLRGQGIAYERTEGMAGRDLFAAAFRRDGFASRLTLARGFVAGAFDTMLCVPDPSLPFGRGVEAFARDLAGHLARG